jgi:lycopene beta-cyclase
MATYDYIIAGGGAAGLSLAYHLVHSNLRDRSILFLDKERKVNNDRTWCFWEKDPMEFDPIVHKRWGTLLFYGSGQQSEIDLSPYEYRMIRGIDFYRHTLSVLENHTSVTFRYGTVERIEDGEEHARVTVDGEVFTGSWVFDSLFFPQDFTVDTERYHFLKQHFVGWFVKTARPQFRPEAATMFDFRTPQEGAMRFMYILPFSEHEALVEYTLFSADLLPEQEYRDRIRDYMRDVVQEPDYEIQEEESGVIPMTDQPFRRAGGKRIMYTGTKGGMVKASTGFAFHRTQRDCRAIVESLEHSGQPFHGRRAGRRYRVFDRMLLQLLHRRGDLSERIFTDLFLKNPIDRLFRFLNEEDPFRENLKLMATVPWGPFIRAWIKLYIFGRI